MHLLTGFHKLWIINKNWFLKKIIIIRHRTQMQLSESLFQYVRVFDNKSLGPLLRFLFTSLFEWYYHCRLECLHLFFFNSNKKWTQAQSNLRWQSTDYLTSWRFFCRMTSRVFMLAVNSMFWPLRAGYHLVNVYKTVLKTRKNMLHVYKTLSGENFFAFAIIGKRL